MKKIIVGSCISMMLTCLSVAPLWATPVNIDILQGSKNGFDYSLIHDRWGRPYDPLLGTLTGILEKDRGIRLTNIMGTLTAPQGILTITGGSLFDRGRRGNARGYLDYFLTDGKYDGREGRFYFRAENWGYGDRGPNNLSMKRLVLWGSDKEGLGIDLYGKIHPTPEPASILLMGSGLAGVAMWQLRKRKQARQQI